MTTFYGPDTSSDPDTLAPGTEAKRVGSAWTDDDGEPLAADADIRARVLARFIKFFRDLPRFSAYAEAMSVPLQTLEDVFTQAYAMGLDPDRRSGVWLDVIGRLVFEGRAGRTDSQYRPILRAKAAALRSRGRREDLYSVVLLLNPDANVRVADRYPAGFLLNVDDPGDAGTDELVRLARLAKPAGVLMGVAVGDFAIGSVDGTSPGGVIGSVDGTVVGFTIGSVA